MAVSGNGDLILGSLHLRKPLAYQTLNGARREVACAYQLHGRRVRFRTGPYDRTRPLVIDPVFVYSTYLGGSGWTRPSPSRSTGTATLMSPAAPTQPTSR